LIDLANSAAYFCWLLCRRRAVATVVEKEHQEITR